MNMTRIQKLLILFLTLGLFAFTGCQKQEGGIRLAFVTNGIDPFWNNAAAGVRAAEAEFGVQCEVLMPPKGLAIPE